MKKSFKSVLTLCLVIITVFAVSLPGYGQRKKKKSKEAPKTSEGIKLEYNFPADKPLSYSFSTTMDQKMDFNGQEMQVNVAIVLVTTFTSSGKDNNNLKLNVFIDTLSQKVDSPQGSEGGIINDVTGKSFEMVLSSNGKELDVSAAEKLTYSAGGQETNLSQSFLDYFPDMPSNSLKPGDTWVTNDSIKSKVSAGSVKQTVKADNKFEGVVNIDGVDCAKITATFTGTREQALENMGMDIAIKGDLTGTSELYFAVKEGWLVKESSTSKMIGTIDISGANNMTMPLAVDIVTTKFLKK